MDYQRSNILGRVDWLTVVMYMILVVFGFVNIYSSAYHENHARVFDFSQRYGKQFYWIIAAFLLAAVVFVINTRFYYFFAYPIYILSLLSLLTVLVIGATIHGSKSWIAVGAFHIQVAEFAKVATALALAKYLSFYNKSLTRFKTLLNASLIIFIPAALIMLQPDMGSTLIYLAFILVLYREGLSLGVLIAGFMFAVLFILTLIMDRMLIISGLLVLALFFHLIIEKNIKYTLTGLAVFILTGVVLWGFFRIFHYSYSFYIIIFLTVIAGGILLIPLLYKYKLKKTALLYVLLVVSILFIFSVNYVFNNILEEHQRKELILYWGLIQIHMAVGIM